MAWLLILINAAVDVWVLFFGGARRIEGSWFAAFEFHALADERGIKILAAGNLVVLAIISYQMLHK